MPKRLIRQFYAVTLHGVYHVTYDTKRDNFQHSRAVKIAESGQGHIHAGETLASGNYVSIGDFLVVYSYGRRETPEMVNTRYWNGCTSSLVALFRSRQAALNCLATAELKAHDERWRGETNLVLKAIGDDHPGFILSRFADSIVKYL